MSTAQGAIVVGVAACTFLAGIAAPSDGAAARVHHRHVRKAQVAPPEPGSEVSTRQTPPPSGVTGYFGPPPFYGYGYGPGIYGGAPRGDLGFALLGALNGGGFRGFVECGNYYARYPGACGF